MLPWQGKWNILHPRVWYGFLKQTTISLEHNTCSKSTSSQLNSAAIQGLEEDKIVAQVDMPS